MIFDFLNHGMSGLSSATNKNEGRNIPIVAAIAPDAPPIRQPINVADEKTGPAVNCPTAMASNVGSLSRIGGIPPMLIA